MLATLGYARMGAPGARRPGCRRSSNREPTLSKATEQWLVASELVLMSQGFACLLSYGQTKRWTKIRTDRPASQEICVIACTHTSMPAFRLAILQTSVSSYPAACLCADASSSTGALDQARRRHAHLARHVRRSNSRCHSLPEGLRHGLAATWPPPPPCSLDYLVLGGAAAACIRQAALSGV